MKKRMHAGFAAMTLVVSLIAGTMSSVYAEDIEPSGSGNLEESEAQFSGYSDIVMPDTLMGQDVTEDSEFNIEADVQDLNSAAANSDLFPGDDILIEEADAESEQLNDVEIPDALGLDLELIAAEASVIINECTEYSFDGSVSYYLLTPAESGVYHFVGRGIREFSLYVDDTVPIRTFSFEIPDTDRYLVSAELEADVQYAIVISPKSSGGSFYYYQVPECCVKVIADADTDGDGRKHDGSGFQKVISYRNAQGDAASFEIGLFYEWNQSEETVCSLGGADAYYYFLTFSSSTVEPSSNGDGTYYFNLQDPLTGKEYGHCWDEGTVTKAATCSDPGSRRCTCLCGAQKDFEIPVTGDHSWTEDDWHKKSDATIFSAEIQERTCPGCGLTQTRTKGSPLEAHISVTADSVPLKKGQKTTAFKVTLDEGDYITGCTLKNNKIAKVWWNRNGITKIKGKKTGRTSLTITTAAGASKVISIKVSAKAVKAASVKVVNPEAASGTITLERGQKLKLIAQINPFTSQDKIIFLSKKPKIAKVTKKGLITAVSPGTARIIVRAGRRKQKLTVIVN